MTPAISVLSAVEGIELRSPRLVLAALPLALVVLGLLFALQRRGTGRIGALFGPLMLVWFLTIGAMGVRAAASRPDVLLALNPTYAIGFLRSNLATAFLVLGPCF